jgi:outer membrane protein assembly factor BamB
MKRTCSMLMMLLCLGLLMAPNSTWGAGGDLLWERTIAPSPPYQLSTSWLASSSTVCIVFGIMSDASSHVIGYIKAYDMDGTLKWERTLTLGVSYNEYNLTIDGNIVYIFSDSITSSPSWRQRTLGACNANTGQTLWEKNIPMEDSSS